MQHYAICLISVNIFFLKNPTDFILYMVFIKIFGVEDEAIQNQMP